MSFSRVGWDASLKQWQRFPIIALTRLVGPCLFIGVSLLTGGLLNSGTTYAQSPTTITVTTCDETHLSMAITNVKAGGTVKFRCSGDILLNNTLDITKNLTLDGDGQSVTLDGQDMRQVIVVHSGVTFTLQALTIANGRSSEGGGIFNSGTMIIKGIDIFSNKAFDGGGIFNSGMMTIDGCDIDKNTADLNGGGIFNSGTLDISNCSLRSNMAAGGGGIFNVGKMTFSNGLFRANTAVSGGGIENGSSGKVEKISNCSFIHNSASDVVGGGIDNRGMMTITNCDITHNTASGSAPNGDGGGIFNGTNATVRIRESFIANNTASVKGGGIFNRTGGTATSTRSEWLSNNPTNCAPPRSIIDGGGNNDSDGSCFK